MPISEDEKRARLTRALKKGLHDPARVMEMLRTGELQFHDREDACAITHIGVSGPYKNLYVMAMAGEIEAVVALGIELEDYARACGCTSIEADGRPGFRALYEQLGRDRGYNMVSIRYRKEL